MRILMIGQGPSKSGEGENPLEGSTGSGQRLAELSGLTNAELLKRCTAVNLLNEWHGKNGKGDSFPMEDAKKSAEALRVTWRNYDRIVLLGQNVARAFLMSSKPYLSWTSDADGHTVAIVPHPSGINAWYNDEGNRKTAKDFLSALFEGKRQSVVLKNGDRRTRAEYCTHYLESFEQSCRNWVDLATILVEVEQDELFLEVGSKTWDDWARQHAPVSYRLCYMVKARYKALKEAFSNEELKKIPPETAQWASKARNISPAALAKPKVREALMLPKQKAVEAIKGSCPEEHVEDSVRVVCKFAVSQNETIQDAYAAFKDLKDETASFEDFIEFCANEFLDSPHPDGGSFRDQWEKSK